MKSSVEPLEGNKVKVYVEVEESEFDKDIDRAFKAIAREIKLPGFRNGKAPRRVLEARIGVGPAREQALRESVPNYLARAVREHQVDLVAAPEIEITDGTEEGGVEFDATCEVRPEIAVPGYGGLRVELPSPAATDADIDEAMDAERRRHGSLHDIDRPIEVGDFVTLDLSATRDGEPLAGLNADDWSYEVGQGWVADELDEQLTGASAGDELTFSAVPTGTSEPADFTVKVTAVQELELPDVNDDWVSENLGEYESVDEWRHALADQLAEQRLGQARQQYVGEVMNALARLVDVDVPEAMVQNEFQARLKNTLEQFQARRVDIQQFLSATGQDPEGFTGAIRQQSEQAVKLDLALRAVAVAEQIDVSDEELDAEFTQLGVRYGEKPARVRKAYADNDGTPDLLAQMRKSKALDWLVHHAEAVDPEGNAIDVDLLLGHSHDDHDETSEASPAATDQEDGQ
ncbi:MAG: trigger factor [Actinomycetota bacterium]|nr:trigger factor [Actinomycetota bacterium]